MVRQRAMAATLDAGPGAAVSHESAAALWRLPGFAAGPMHVSRVTGRSTLAAVHRTHVPEAHIRLFERIPVTSPARTIFDLAGVLHPGRTERALDNALARGLTSVGALNRVTGELAGPGRPGSALMRRLLAERDASYVPPESNMEARLQSVAKRAGLHTLVRQRDVGGDDWIGRVDFLDPEKRVASRSTATSTTARWSTRPPMPHGMPRWPAPATRSSGSRSMTSGTARTRSSGDFLPPERP